jgi:predicted transcriptional regulator
MRPLDPRRREIARLVGRGMTSPEIARELGISLRTVQVLRAAIVRKTLASADDPFKHPAVKRTFRRLRARLADLSKELAALRKLASGIARVRADLRALPKRKETEAGRNRRTNGRVRSTSAKGARSCSRR